MATIQMSFLKIEYNSFNKTGFGNKINIFKTNVMGKIKCTLVGTHFFLDIHQLGLMQATFVFRVFRDISEN